MNRSRGLVHIKSIASSIRSAIRYGEYDDLRKLLEQIDPNDPRLVYSELPLIVALREGTPRAVEVVLQAGADPNGNGFSMEVLWEEDTKEVPEKLELLLRYGLSLEKAGHLPRTLYQIIKREEESEDLWRLLKPHLFALENPHFKEWKEFLLQEAAYHHRGELLAEFARENGLDFSIRDKEGRTLLHYWAEGVFSPEATNLPYFYHLSDVPERFLKEAETSLNVLLSSGLDINAQDNLGNTPLHHACGSENGSAEFIKLLLQAGANPKIENLEGRSPLFYLPPRADGLLKLLSEHGADLKAKDKGGTSLLMAFAERASQDERFATGFLSSLNFLLESGLDPREKNAEGNTFLIVLLRGLELETVGKYDFSRNAFYELMEKAVSQGVLLYETDINARDKNKNTLLHYAIEFFNEDDARELRLIRSLLEAGLDPNARNVKGETPAHFAVRKKNRVEILSLLKEFGADLNAKDNKEKSVALRYIENSSTWVQKEVKRLSSLGLDFKDEKILFYLLRQWNELSEKSTAFARSGIQFLIKEVGLSPNVRDEQGNTPLHLAYRSTSRSRFLIELGAKPWKRNLEGKTPGDLLALDLGYPPVFPGWAVELGMLPLQNQELLLEILEAEGKRSPLNPPIERFLRGIVQDDPLVFMGLLPHIFSFSPNNTVRMLVEKTLQKEFSADFKGKNSL